MLRNIFLKYWYQSQKANLPVEWENVLVKYSVYYRQLNPDSKKKFLRRLYVNMKIKDFIPVRFSSVQDEMRILILSALVQITFGMKEYTFNRFEKIYILPSRYNLGGYENLLGHVDMGAKVICLSWPSVKEGFIIPDDAMNVALHEMAHAIMEENRFRVLGFKFFSDKHITAWGKEAYEKLLLIRSGTELVLNSYGGRNMLEMFAVCMETFFEKPTKFKNELPALFNKLADVLNQDTTKPYDPVTNKLI